MDRKNAWTTYSREELDRLEQVNTEYKSCLDAGKTERECVTLAVEKAKAEGYKDIRDVIKNGGEVKAGEAAGLRLGFLHCSPKRNGGLFW